jgi:hypothetical protein
MTQALSLQESPESSSPLVTRAVAAGLSKATIDSYTLAGWQRLALRIISLFPQGVARFAISRFESFSGLDPSRLANLSIDSLVATRLQDYANLPEKFPAITLGAALGGASAFIALAINGPFLPQAFVATLKGGAPDGDVSTYFKRASALALEIASKNPNVLTIQHYDPIHDEWMTRRVNHLRIKLLDLPEKYADFIKRRLLPGGSVCYLDCQAQWLRYRVGERSVFQVGGWGDISPQEFLEGSERVGQYAKRVDLKKTGWRLPGFPLEEGPESEWGSEPGLVEALQTFCDREGYKFVRISLPEPHAYSKLAWLSMQRMLEQDGRQPSGAIIEMFSQFDPSQALQSGLLPLWLVFNTWDSLRFLQEMLPAFPEGKPVFFSPLATFTQTPDIVPWTEWENCLQGKDWTNIGARSSHYPADALALIEWQKPLSAWVSRNGTPVKSRLDASELAELSLSVSPTTAHE